MKILLDENLPKRLRCRLQERDEVPEVKTAQEMGWAGKKNGELLGLLTLDGFESFITLDKNLYQQQNLDKFSITIIVLRVKSNKYEDIQLILPDLYELLGNLPAQKLIAIEG